jgi:hypothetical protein
MTTVSTWALATVTEAVRALYFRAATPRSKAPEPPLRAFPGASCSGGSGLMPSCSRSSRCFCHTLAPPSRTGPRLRPPEYAHLMQQPGPSLEGSRQGTQAPRSVGLIPGGLGFRGSGAVDSCTWYSSLAVIGHC